MTYEVQTIGDVRAPVAIMTSSPGRDAARIAAMGGIGACAACDKAAGAMGAIGWDTKSKIVGATSLVAGVGAGIYAYHKSQSLPVAILAALAPPALAIAVPAVALLVLYAPNAPEKAA